MSLKYTNSGGAQGSSTSWTLKCTDLPQFDALQAAAEEFDDHKLHLRNLCSDTARCAGLTALHTSPQQGRKMVLDYSRQRVTGEIAELLYDLADAMSLTDRIRAMRNGSNLNATENRPVLHHLLRAPLAASAAVDDPGWAPNQVALSENVRPRAGACRHSQFQARVGPTAAVEPDPRIAPDGGQHDADLARNCPAQRQDAGLLAAGAPRDRGGVDRIDAPARSGGGIVVAPSSVGGCHGAPDGGQSSPNDVPGTELAHCQKR
jgi:Phosphoglucose isomerase